MPYVSADLITTVQGYVASGRLTGRILFTSGSSNLPAGVTALQVEFKTFDGTSAIYLDGYERPSSGVIKKYVGVIASGQVTWAQL